jgi:hypothetical protein
MLKIVLLGVNISDLICQPQFYIFAIMYCVSLTLGKSSLGISKSFEKNII